MNSFNHWCKAILLSALLMILCQVGLYFLSELIYLLCRGYLSMIDGLVNAWNHPYTWMYVGAALIDGIAWGVLMFWLRMQPFIKET